MSVLELSGRPYTVFDPEDKQHRSYYHDFVQSGTWGRCPWRFVVPEDHGDLVTMIQRALVEFYVNKEFKDVAQKPQPLVRQKKQKTVDSKAV
jgi:hypothetical protein